MTKQEAIIASAYTGTLFPGVRFSDVHKIFEEKMGRPIFTHEFASDDFNEYIKRKFRKDFLSIKVK